MSGSTYRGGCTCRGEVSVCGLTITSFSTNAQTYDESKEFKLVWTFLFDTCFHSVTESKQTGEHNIILRNCDRAHTSYIADRRQAEHAEAQNKDRSLRNKDATERKRVGAKVDLLFAIQLFELGAVGASADSDRCSTKSIVELGLKCPKL